jgi:hypothetical protein
LLSEGCERQHKGERGIQQQASMNVEPAGAFADNQEIAVHKIAAIDGERSNFTPNLVA